MKIGFQTISWGRRVERRDIGEMLRVIGEAGYEGVEFMQRPDGLPPIDKLLGLLKERGLKLIGLTGGSLAERMRYCGDFRPEYLYLDSWDSEVVDVSIERGFLLGLHPHVFMPIQHLSDVERLLADNPKLRFNPDTAHLAIAGADPVEAIRRFSTRIVAVHLKDWTPEFGRSSHRYARGFVELGAGAIDLDGVLAVLLDIRYDGWLVVEQDSAASDPATSTFKCAKWLADRNLLPEPPPFHPRTIQPVLAARRTLDREASFLEAVLSTERMDIQSCYERIARAFQDLCECELVTIWTCSPAQDVISLVAVASDQPIPIQTVVCERREVLCGDTVERRAVTRFDLASEEVVKRFEQPELMDALNLGEMVSVPVFNPCNLNHVKLIINLFPKGRSLQIDDEVLFDLGEYVAIATESSLGAICSTSAAKLNLLAAKSKRVEDFLGSLVQLVKETISCKDLAFFLVNDSGDKLELTKATTGTIWNVQKDQEFYSRGEGLTGRVWETKGTLLTAHPSKEPGWKGKSFEGVERREEDACLFVPLTRLPEQVIGVVRCQNKSAPLNLGKGEFFFFSEDDAAILEAIAQAAVPHLELLLAHQRRERALGRLTHELKVPIVAIQGAAQFMGRRPGVRHLFDCDYLGDIWSWTQLMSRLVDNAEALRYGIEEMRTKPDKTRLLWQVIAPAIRQVRLLLQERQFSSRNIEYDKEALGAIPELWLDRNQFQQVMFNLLTNAIKYAYDRPDAFQVEIGVEVHASGFRILFQDWGVGIELGTEELIFQEGFRGEKSVEMNVGGQGLGLWLVQRIVERHGGSIGVTNVGLPTEIEIQLPYWLASRPPV